MSLKFIISEADIHPHLKSRMEQRGAIARYGKNFKKGGDQK